MGAVSQIMAEGTAEARRDLEVVDSVVGVAMTRRALVGVVLAGRADMVVTRKDLGVADSAEAVDTIKEREDSVGVALVGVVLVGAASTIKDSAVAAVMGENKNNSLLNLI